MSQRDIKTQLHTKLSYEASILSEKFETQEAVSASEWTSCRSDLASEGSSIRISPQDRRMCNTF